MPTVHCFYYYYYYYSSCVPLPLLLTNSPLFSQIPLLCIAAAYDPSRCKGNYLGKDAWLKKLDCEFNSEVVDFRKCYFKRTEAICTSNSDRYQRYQSLFDAPDANALQSQYESIVGPDFELVDPTLQAMFNSIDNTVAQPDVAAARELCDASLWDSMDLDKAKGY